MDDLISRQAAITAIKTIPDGNWKNKRYVSVIMSIPPAQPETKKGRWLYQKGHGWGETWICSECGEETISSVIGTPRYKWCPMCGADMRGDNKDDCQK